MNDNNPPTSTDEHDGISAERWRSADPAYRMRTALSIDPDDPANDDAHILAAYSLVSPNDLVKTPPDEARAWLRRYRAFARSGDPVDLFDDQHREWEAEKAKGRDAALAYVDAHRRAGTMSLDERARFETLHPGEAQRALVEEWTPESFAAEQRGEPQPTGQQLADADRRRWEDERIAEFDRQVFERDREALLAALVPAMTDETRALFENLRDHDFRFQDGDIPALARLPKEQRELYETLAQAYRPTTGGEGETWLGRRRQFVAGAWQNLWHMAWETGYESFATELRSDATWAIHGSEAYENYRDVRRIRRELLAPKLADLGPLANPAMDAAGIVGYMAPTLAMGFAGKVAQGARAATALRTAAAGSAAAKAATAAKAAAGVAGKVGAAAEKAYGAVASRLPLAARQTLAAAEIAAPEALSPLAKALTPGRVRLAAYAMQERQTMLDRMAEEGGDVSSVAAQALAVAAPLAIAWIEDADQVFAGEGSRVAVERAKMDAYAKIVSRIPGRVGQYLSKGAIVSKSAERMGLSEAAKIVGKDVAFLTFYEALEEAAQQTIEEVAVESCTRAGLDPAEILGQGWDAFYSSLGPMLITMGAGTGKRAQGYARGYYGAGASAPAIVESAKAIRDAHAKAGTRRVLTAEEEERHAFTVSRLYGAWARATDEGARYRALAAAGLDDRQIPEVMSAFLDLSAAATPAQLADLFGKGAAPRSAAEILSSDDRIQGLRLLDDGTTVERDITMPDGKVVTLRVGTSRAAEVGDISSGSEAALSSVSEWVAANPDAADALGLHDYGIDFTQTRAENIERIKSTLGSDADAEAAYARAFAEIAKKLSSRGATTPVSVKTDKATGRVTVHAGITLANSAEEETAYHEYGHAIEAALRTAGNMTEEQVAAFREAFGAPEVGRETWNEERGAVRAESLAQPSTPDPWRPLRSIARMLGIRKALREKAPELKDAMDVFLLAYRTGKFDGLGTVTAAKARLREKRAEAEDAAKREAPSAPEAPADPTAPVPAAAQAAASPASPEGEAPATPLSPTDKFESNQPLTSAEMAEVARALDMGDGREATRTVLEGGWRWSENAGVWTHFPTLENQPVALADRYFGADGKWHDNYAPGDHWRPGMPVLSDAQASERRAWRLAELKKDHPAEWREKTSLAAFMRTTSGSDYASGALETIGLDAFRRIQKHYGGDFRNATEDDVISRSKDKQGIAHEKTVGEYIENTGALAELGGLSAALDAAAAEFDAWQAWIEDGAPTMEEAESDAADVSDAIARYERGVEPSRIEADREAPAAPAASPEGEAPSSPESASDWSVPDSEDLPDSFSVAPRYSVSATDHDGTLPDTLPASIRAAARRIYRARAGRPGYMAEPDGTPTLLSERDWLAREARYAVSPTPAELAEARRQYDALGTQAKAAMDELAEGRDATIHNDLGDISYAVGSPGKMKPSRKIKGGVGFLHIVYSRMAKDGRSLEEAIDTAILVADTVETGVEVERRGNKHYYRKGEIEAVVAVNPDTSKPVLTGYEIRADGTDGEIPASSDLHTLPPPLKEDVVAALKKRLAQLRSGVKQKITSAGTSLLHNDPTLYKSKWLLNALKPGSENFDIGAGRTERPTRRLAERGVRNVPFDPFNRPQETNASAIREIEGGKRYPTVTVANVLNVIAEPESRSNVILQAAKALAPDGRAFFDVYTAPKEGETKAGTYQTAMRPEQYVPELERWFGKVERHGSILVASEPKPEVAQAKAEWWDANPAEGGNTLRYSVTPADDAAYMDAVRRGDMETAAKMVREVKNHVVNSVGSDLLYALNKIAKAYGTKPTNIDRPHNVKRQKELYELKGRFIAAFGKFIETHRVKNGVSNLYKIGNNTFHDFRSLYEFFKPEANALGERYGVSTRRLDGAIGLSDGTYFFAPFPVDVEFFPGKEKEVSDINKKYEQYIAMPEINDIPRDIDQGHVDRLGGEVEIERQLRNLLNKSAAPVTYDDAGNVIPLSQRFNPERDDIRYKVAARPSPEFAMDGTIADALPAHLREDARAIIEERDGMPAWMADPDGTPTDLNERDWLRREAERRHGEQRFAIGTSPSPAELAEAARQYDEVVARYTNPDGTRKPGWKKAPNGADTHLTERQWVQVRTPAFKAWFGDWENDPANASKVVDENGEPRVMWRGAPFDPLSQAPGKGVIAAERYFTPSEAYARRYEKGAGATRAYFLNVRSPFDVRNARDAARMLELRGGHDFHVGSTGALDWAEAPTAEEIEELWPGEYDGLVLDEGGDPAESGPAYRGESVVPFAGGAQVKSATDNTGVFSARPDIRYSIKRSDEFGGVWSARAEAAFNDGRYPRPANEAYFDATGKKAMFLHAVYAYNPDAPNTTEWHHFGYGMRRIRVDGPAAGNLGELMDFAIVNWMDDANAEQSILSRIRELAESADDLADADLPQEKAFVLKAFGRDKPESFDEDAARARFESAMRGITTSGQSRYSISGLYTGSAADYAERVPVLDKDGNVTGYRIDNGPSLQHVGSGEGNQAFGWGLYGSRDRSVAEDFYAKNDVARKSATRPSAKMEIFAAVSTIDPAKYPLGPSFPDARYGGYRMFTPQEYVANIAKNNGWDTIKTYEALRAELSGYMVKQNKRDFLRECRDWMENEFGITKKRHRNAPLKTHVLEQTFFSNRTDGEGTERHLLQWYGPVGEERIGWIREQWDKERDPEQRARAYFEKEYVQKPQRKFDFRRQEWREDTYLWQDYGATVEEAWEDRKERLVAQQARISERMDAEMAALRPSNEGRGVYTYIARILGSDKEASDFLYRAGIDGVVYPTRGRRGAVDLQSKDFNVVAFRDDNIRVDHKWVDGVQRYSIVPVPSAFDPGRLPASMKWGTLHGHDGNIVGLVAMCRLSGKKIGNDEISDLAQRLGVEMSAKEIRDKARDLADSEIGALALGRALNGDMAGGMAILAGTAEPPSTDRELVDAAFRAGAKRGLAADAMRRKVTADVLAAQRGADLSEIVREFGFDWAKMLHSWEIEAEKRPEGAKPLDTLPNPYDFAGAMEDPDGTKAEAHAARVAEARRIAAERFSALFAEARRMQEYREEVDAETADKSGGGTGGDDAASDAAGDDPGDLPEPLRPEALPIPAELIAQTGLDIRDAATFALALRVGIRDMIWRADPTHEGAFGAGLDGDRLEDADYRFWQNPAALDQYRKSMVAILLDMADKLLDHNSTAYRRAREAAVRIRRDTTADRIESDTADVLRTISAASIRQTTRALVADTRTELQKKFIDRTTTLDSDYIRKMTGAVQRRARWIHRVLGLTEEQVAAEFDRLERELSDRSRLYEEAVQSDTATTLTEEEDQRYREALWMRADLEAYGGTRYLLPGAAKERCDAIRKWMQDSAGEWSRRLVAFERDMEKKRGIVLAAVANTVRDADGKPRDVVHEKDSAADERYYRHVALLDQRLRDIFRFAQGDKWTKADALRDEWQMKVARATETYETRMQRLRKAFEDAVVAVVGRDGAADWLRRMEDEIPEEQAALLSREGRRHLTYGQVLHLYGYLCQTGDYSDNIHAHGRDGQRDYIEREVLTKEDIDIFSRIRAIYADERDELSEAKRRQTGLGFGAPDPWYAPVKVRTPARDGAPVEASTWDLMPEVFQERRRHGLDVDETADALALFWDRAEAASRMIAYGDLGVEMLHVLCDGKVKAAIERYHGKTALSGLLAHVGDTLAGGHSVPGAYRGQDVRLLSRLRNAVTHIALCGNLSPALNQTVSSPVFALARETGLGSVFRDMLAVATPGWKTACREWMESDGFKARYGAGGVMGEIKSALTTQRGVVTRWQRLLALGYAPIQIGDMIPSILVGVSVYRAERDRLLKMGMDEAAARRDAATRAFIQTEATQQSSRIENQTALVRRGDVGIRLFTMFRSASVLQLSWQSQRARELRAAVDPEGAHDLLWCLAHASGNERAEHARKKFAEAIIVNNLVVPPLMQLVATLFAALLGKKPDEKDLVSLGAGVLLGAGNALPIVSYAVWTALGVATEGKGYLYSRRQSTAPSLFGTVDRLIATGGITAWDLLTFDLDAALDDADRFLQSSASPYRHVRQAVENWGGED